MSNPALKMPGESNPDFARACAEYIGQFHSSIRLDMRRLDRTEFYAWCSQTLGQKYKDWFVVESGSLSQKAWTLHIRSPKKSTFVRIKYNESIIDSVDIADN